MVITQHAYDKAKERLGWNSSTLDRMAERIYSSGICHNQTRGKLKKFIDSKYEVHGTQNVKIYGQNIYFFKGEKLITMYALPSEYIKYVEQKKRN